MKQLIGKLGVTSVLLITLSMAANAKEKIYKLKLATTWGKTTVPLVSTPINMAKYAEELSNGRLIIKVHTANKHKAPFGVFDMVKGGQYDIAHTSSYYWKGKDIDLLPFTSMPFGMTGTELYAWFYYGGGLELMKKAHAKHKILSYPGGNTGMQMGGWFRKEIKSLKDLKGLKMRIPGFAGEIMAKTGVLVTNLAPGELYTALERGTIDALEWVGPSMDIKMGFHKVAPYYYTGWHEPGSEAQFLLSEKSFNKLPKDLQNVLVKSMKLAAYDMFIENYHLNSVAWEEMLKDYPNIKVRTLPKEVLNELKKANKELRAEISKKSPLLKEILESQNNYLKRVRKWTEMSDYLYFKDNLSN